MVESAAKLIKKQNKLATYIKNFNENTRKSKAQRNFTASDLKARLDLLENYWLGFLANQMTLTDVEETLQEDSYFMHNVYDAMVDSYLYAKARHNNMLSELLAALAPLSTSNTGQSAPPGYSMQASLEKVKLPKFSGNQRDWQMYKEKFKALILNDAAMMSVLKFQHFLNSLEGEAADLLKGVEVIGPNFATAWQTLCTRYDDKQLRFNAQMKALVNLLSASRESVTHLNTLLNTTKESINVFKSLERLVDSWDDILVYFIESKLSPETRLDWAKGSERERKSNEFAKHKELCNFLETRIKTLDRVDSETQPTSSKSRENSHSQRSKSHKSNGRNKQHTSSLTTFQKLNEQNQI